MSKPAEAIYVQVHGDWIWSVYDVGSGYDVYRVEVSKMRRHFVDSFKTRFFAKRCARKGTRP